MTFVRAFVLALCLTPIGIEAQEPLEQSFESDVLVIVGAHACYRFDIYLAISPPSSGADSCSFATCPNAPACCSSTAMKTTARCG